jgi:hypothetical protein
MHRIVGDAALDALLRAAPTPGGRDEVCCIL